MKPQRICDTHLIMCIMLYIPTLMYKVSHEGLFNAIFNNGCLIRLSFVFYVKFKSTKKYLYIFLLLLKFNYLNFG